MNFFDTFSLPFVPFFSGFSCYNNSVESFTDDKAIPPRTLLMQKRPQSMKRRGLRAFCIKCFAPVLTDWA